MPGNGFDDFVDARLDVLLRYASVLTCDADLAQDIVREVLVRVKQRWRRIAAGEPTTHVQRMITEEYLSPKRHRDVHEAAPATGGDAMLARIAVLPAKQRAALVLRYHEDRTEAEIAEVLGCASALVSHYLARALSSLQADKAIASTGEAS